MMFTCVGIKAVDETAQVCYVEQNHHQLLRWDIVRWKIVVTPMPDGPDLGDVAFTRCVNRPEMSHSLAVFRVLSHADVNPILPNKQVLR